MRNIKLKIAYDGSRYYGWQRLKDNDQTIQGKLESVISEMVQSHIEIIGSGRTDAGVHATGQITNFHTDSKMTIEEMHHYINRYLPQDIVVKEMVQASERFHSRYHVKSKKYTYYVWNHFTHSPFHRKYSYHLPEELDVPLMKEAAEKFIGTHDFIGFSSLKKTKKSTIRTIDELSISSQDYLMGFSFVGDGFLYNMIRIIMGSLVEIGLHEKELSHIDKVLEKNVRSKAGITMPPQGLFLEEVYY
ncbi:tRNA pseudouridine(38-40) synthase TruA [Alkalibaculum bacchi]|jgi:tRNA pseudouridine38-40 synthase|uniref:tRNA pseudouridine(38-40) synthase TruA n=1 Tax=Alkalibaculum bacchi TaxID=645887 RepID=UPI0026F2BB06|nr:tRNA pseudouridine(38-40) synthase TruA [Alkalibaculum bacchi]